MTAHLPHSPSCERNRLPIAQALDPHVAAARRVLEIGSGTGEHAVFFAQRWPWLQWQPSDHPDHLSGIDAWRMHARLPNLLAPIPLQAVLEPVPGLSPLPGEARAAPYDVVFTANTLHIMSWPHVEALFAGLPALLAPEALLVVYGPFKRDGRHTSESNVAFDGWLAHQYGPQSAVRDREAVQALATARGLRFVEDIAMPANNRLLVWRRV